MRFEKLWDEAVDWLKTLCGALIAFFAFTTVAFGNYAIPSESMVPTLEVGDRVVVSKFAYGYSRHSLAMNLGVLLPPARHRLFERLPERGDVSVFTHPYDGHTIIKRVIGLPGDVIEVRRGRVFINGVGSPSTAPIALTRRSAPGNLLEAATRREETLSGGARHTVFESAVYNPLDDFGPYRVPEAHVFMMGDHRDNSLDSRHPAMGAIPIENLIGRAETVYFAPRPCAPTAVNCRSRWLRPMRE